MSSCRRLCKVYSKTKCLINGNLLITRSSLCLFGCLISTKESSNWEIGFTKDSQMSFGYQDSLSQQALPLHFSNKLPESLMFLLINSCGNFHSRNSMPLYKHQLKKAPTLMVFSWKEPSGMATKIVLLNLNLWNSSIRCRSFNWSPFLCKESKKQRKVRIYTHVQHICIPSEPELLKENRICFQWCFLLNQEWTILHQVTKTSGLREVLPYSCR